MAISRPDPSVRRSNNDIFEDLVKIQEQLAQILSRQDLRIELLEQSNRDFREWVREQKSEPPSNQ